MFPDVKFMHEIDVTTFTNQSKFSSKITEYYVFNFHLHHRNQILSHISLK